MVAALCRRRARGALLLVLAGAALASADPAQAQEWTGTLHEIWTDPGPDSQSPTRVDYVLTEDDGSSWLLDVDPGRLAPGGVWRSWLGRRVAVSGGVLRGPDDPTGQGTLAAASIAPLEPLAALSAGPARAEVTGEQRYVTVMCRFANSTDEQPRDLATYKLWMGDPEPGMGDYWTELSNGQVDFEGSEVVGWYELPSPISSYFSDPAPGERENPSWQALAQACASLADGDVDFNGVDGVNLQFNLRFGASWGGTSSLTLDGQQRVVGTTWMAAWAGQSVYGHEVGHSFGLPHSSGPYGETYDSEWDVMSDSYVRFDQSLQTWIGQHTVGYHKDVLGWIPASRKVSVDGLGTTHSVFLDFWGEESTGGVLLLEIPLDGGEYLTAEARRHVGYDQGAPHSGMVMHSINQGRSRPAWVVDVDGNGHPNDQASVWQAGEAYNDGERGITIEVIETTSEGMSLEVAFGWQLDLTIVGDGRVVSTPGGVDCTESCKPLFTTPQSFTLEAVESSNLVFSGWGEACSGTDPCQVELDENESVSAFFLEDVGIGSEEERPEGTVGVEYSDQLAATGGTGSYGWALTGGALPDGVRLTGSSGVIAGTPREAGDFQFDVSVTSGPLSATSSFRMSVGAPTLDRTAVFDQLLGGPATLTEAELLYLDIIGNENGRLDVGDVWIFLRSGSE